MLTVDSYGGRAMMEAAVEAAFREGRETGKRPLVLAVTVLTSLDYAALTELGIMDELNIADPDELRSYEDNRMKAFIVHELAWLANECGVDGVVASPQEVVAIREYLGPNLVIVTPGIRPSGAQTFDQLRTGTPAQAIRDGVTHLVVGRPITTSPDPVEAACAIVAEIESARVH